MSSVSSCHELSSVATQSACGVCVSSSGLHIITHHRPSHTYSVDKNLQFMTVALDVSLCIQRNDIHYENWGIWFECMRCVKTAEDNPTHILIIIVVVFICFGFRFIQQHFFLLFYHCQRSTHMNLGTATPKFGVYASFIRSFRFPNESNDVIYDYDGERNRYMILIINFWRGILSHNSNLPAIDRVDLFFIALYKSGISMKFLCWFCENRRNLNATQ